MYTTNLAEQDSIISIIPEGDLLEHSYHDIEKALHHAMRPGTQVVVRLDRTPFISSSGIGFLLRLKQVAERGGGRLSLHNPTSLILRIFSKLKLDEVFHITTGPVLPQPATVFMFRVDSPHGCEVIPHVAPALRADLSAVSA